MSDSDDDEYSQLGEEEETNQFVEMTIKVRAASRGCVPRHPANSNTRPCDD